MRKKRGFALKMLAVLICSLMVLSLTAAGAAADGDMPVAEGTIKEDPSENPEVNESSEKEPGSYESSEKESGSSESSEEEPEAYEGSEKETGSNAGSEKVTETKAGLAKAAGDGAGEEEGDPASGGAGGAVPLTDGGIIRTGYYYLADDVKLTQAIYIPTSQNVTINLNGHILDRGLTSAEDNGCVIKVDGTLTITDGQPEAEHDPEVTFTSGFDNSTLTVKGGVITGGYNTGNGGGIIIGNHLILKGGTIAGNVANRGGGLFCTSGGILEMTDGKIMANIATDSSDGGGGGGIANYGTLYIGGGTISDNKIARDHHGCGIRQFEGSLTLSGGVITRNTGTRGGGIYVRGGTFTMTGGTITGNHANEGGGVGVTNDIASFVMEGGTITGNSANVNGGGVLADNETSFTMSGGTISKNKTSGKGEFQGGGGVYAEAVFTMTGGTITENTSGLDGGGVFALRGFTMKGKSEISNNKSTYGAGVYVKSARADFEMEGGTISGNKAQYLAGGVYVQAGSGFVMSGGTITENTVERIDFNKDGCGGGVFVLKAGDFKMTGGTISKNSAPADGGGVCCKGDLISVTNGKIFGNHADRNGGGVYVIQTGEAPFKDTEIKDNTAGGRGGGIYTLASTKTTLSGKMSITGNTDSTGASDFMLTSEKGLVLSGIVSGTIGVDTDNPDFIITSSLDLIGASTKLVSNVAGYEIDSRFHNMEKEYFFVPIPYSVTVDNSIANGTVQADKTKAVVNEEITLTVSPAAGYVLKTLTYTPENGDAVEVTAGENNAYTFNMPAASVTVTAAFAELLAGNVDISGSAVYGKTLTASFIGGYNTGTLSYQWRRNGEDIEGAAGNTYTLTEEDVGNQITCAVTSSAQPGEVVSGSVTVQKASITVSAEPQSSEYGWDIKTIAYRVTGDYVEGDVLDITAGTTADKNSDAGEYPITVTCGDDPRYEINTEGNIYTIEKTSWQDFGPVLYVKRGSSVETDIADFVEKGGSAAVLSVMPEDFLSDVSLQGTSLTASVKNDARVVGNDVDVTVSVTDAVNYEDYSFYVTLRIEEKDPFAVTVVNGEGSGSFVEGETVTVKAGSAPEGHEFTGWTSADGVDFADASSEETTFTMPDKAVTVTANYKAKIFKVTFVDENGTTLAESDVEYAKTADKPDCTAPDGYKLDGWYQDPAFTKAYDFSTPVASDTIVYVKWAAIAYVVTDITGVTNDNAHTWTRGSGKAVVITVKPAEGEDHSFTHFTGVAIDGKTLKSGTDYTAREGSTIVTIKSETLEALSDGAHTAQVQFDNGTAEVKLTVQKASDSKPPAKDKDAGPKTGDTNNSVSWVILIAAAAAVIAAAVPAISGKTKKRQ